MTPSPGSPDRRLVALMGGGDWADASVEHLLVPVGVSMDEIKAAWREWYENAYILSLREAARGESPKIKYQSLADFAVSRFGAVLATESDVEEYWDD